MIRCTMVHRRNSAWHRGVLCCAWRQHHEFTGALHLPGPCFASAMQGHAYQPNIARATVHAQKKQKAGHVKHKCRCEAWRANTPRARAKLRVSKDAQVEVKCALEAEGIDRDAWHRVHAGQQGRGENGREARFTGALRKVEFTGALLRRFARPACRCRHISQA